MGYLPIYLTRYHIETAAQDAVDEFIDSREKGLKHRPGFELNIENFWTLAIEAKAGEMAVAKLTSTNYVHRLGAYSSPDVANMQVKTRLKHWQELRVRATDPDEQIYVLVTRDLRDRKLAYQIWGWMYGKDAKNPAWYKDPDNTGEFAYFVPHSEMRRMSSLPPEALKECPTTA